MAKSPDTVLVSMVISNPSTVTAYNVTVDFDFSSGMLADYSTMEVNTTFSSEITSLSASKLFKWNPGNILGMEKERILKLDYL